MRRLAWIVALWVMGGSICSYGMHAGLGAEAAGEASRWSFRGGFMLQQGEAREIVFAGDHQLSELIWDISGLIYGGGVVSYAVSPSIQLNAGFRTALNEGDGSMVDYDWFIEDAAWTHFSDGDVDINSAYTFDANGYWRVMEVAGVDLYAIAGYKRMFWDWSQYGGSYIYSENGFRDSRGVFPADQNGIDYEQTFDVPYIGVGGRMSLGQLSGSAYLLYSPFVQAEDRDHHILRDLKFKETFENIDYVAIGAEGIFMVTDTIFVSGALDIHSIPEARGDMVIYDASGQTQYNPGNAGIENTAIGLSAMAGLVF